MKRFAILRDVDPDVVREDIDAGAIETILNLAFKGEDALQPAGNVNWVRSYWSPGNRWGMCLYTGTDDVAIERYHEVCELPYVTITQVEEADDPGAGDYRNGLSRTEPALLAVERPIRTDYSSWESLGARWIRSYLDGQHGAEVALVRPGDGRLCDVQGLVAERGWTAHPVVEIRPEEYLDQRVE